MISDTKCGCRKCLRERGEGQKIGDLFIPQEMMQMILCQICGNKRCPHANDHNNECTNSNAPGQIGSAY